MSDQLSTNQRGGYRFLPAIAPYSSGVVALPGFEIVHVTLQRPLPWKDGMTAARAHVEASGGTQHNLCAFELRCPAPFTLQGFVDFNREYRALLKDWDMMVDGINPVARTNVAPVVSPPAESVVHAFFWTRPSVLHRPTFVVVGGGELPDGELAERRIVRAGETSASAMLEKADCVVGLMNGRLTGLEATDELITAIDVYTAHPLHELLNRILIPQIPAAARVGVQWHYTRPPIVDIEFEMD
ncbi:MAG: hypothetical protein KDA96_23510, partial [Planctomycetaceae bacterium]|nr:hypothetical protein [Planctomycetaceae bacterium]